jgi:hypothetical protein
MNVFGLSPVCRRARRWRHCVESLLSLPRPATRFLTAANSLVWRLRGTARAGPGVTATGRARQESVAGDANVARVDESQFRANCIGCHGPGVSLLAEYRLPPNHFLSLRSGPGVPCNGPETSSSAAMSSCSQSSSRICFHGWQTTSTITYVVRQGLPRSSGRAGRRRRKKGRRLRSDNRQELGCPQLRTLSEIPRSDSGVFLLAIATRSRPPAH